MIFIEFRTDRNTIYAMLLNDSKCICTCWQTSLQSTFMCTAFVWYFPRYYTKYPLWAPRSVFCSVLCVCQSCMFIYFVRIIFVCPEMPLKFMKFWHSILFIETLATRAKNNNNNMNARTCQAAQLRRSCPCPALAVPRIDEPVIKYRTLILTKNQQNAVSSSKSKVTSVRATRDRGA